MKDAARILGVLGDDRCDSKRLFKVKPINSSSSKTSTVVSDVFVKHLLNEFI